MLESGLSGGCLKLGVCREELTVLLPVLLGVECCCTARSLGSGRSLIVPLLQTKGAEESPGLILHSA